MELGLMNVEYRFYKALNSSKRRVVNSSHWNWLFSQRCAKEHLTFSVLLEPRPLLCQLLTATGPRKNHFCAEVCAYNRVLSMASFKANWMNRCLGDSTFNSTDTMQGQIYPYMGPLIPAQAVQPEFLSMYIHNNDSDAHSA